MQPTPDESCVTCKYFDGECCINQMSDSYHCPVTDEMICGGWEYDIYDVNISLILDDIADDLDPQDPYYRDDYYALQKAAEIVDEKIREDRERKLKFTTKRR
jgi:hypothetical protein